jgi:hypothetical protein
MKLGLLQIILIFFLIYFLLGGNIKFLQKILIKGIKNISDKVRELFNLK